MGWLIGPLLGGVLGGIVVVRILEFLLGGVSSGVMNVVKPISFIGTTAGVTTVAGMSRFTSLARKFRRGTGVVEEHIDAITKSDRQK